MIRELLELLADLSRLQGDVGNFKAKSENVRRKVEKNAQETEEMLQINGEGDWFTKIDLCHCHERQEETRRDKQ